MALVTMDVDMDVKFHIHGKPEALSFVDCTCKRFGYGPDVNSPQTAKITDTERRFSLFYKF